MRLPTRQTRRFASLIWRSEDQKRALAVFCAHLSDRVHSKDVDCMRMTELGSYGSCVAGVREVFTRV